MNFKMQVAIVAFVVSTIALAPVLISSQPAHAISKCEDEKGSSHIWITGCKDGWYNWDVCGVGPKIGGGTGQYEQGYEAGWKKGQEHNPNRTGCS